MKNNERFGGSVDMNTETESTDIVDIDTVNDDIVKILWTGGYDSSFRVCQLSKLPVKIKPYYLAGTRLSLNNELNAIRSITNALKAKPDTKCTFLDLEIVPKEDREMVEEVSAAYIDLRQENAVGSQYEWLGWFAKKHPGIEMGVLKQGRVEKLASKYGALKKISDPLIGDYYVVDKDKSSQSIIDLYGNYRFPLQDFNKIEMRDEYIRLNCQDIADLTWFCHKPIDNESCGRCGPCSYTISEGLSQRFSPKAMRRYKMRRLRKKFMKWLRATKFWGALRKVKWGLST